MQPMQVRIKAPFDWNIKCLTDKLQIHNTPLYNFIFYATEIKRKLLVCYNFSSFLSTKCKRAFEVFYVKKKYIYIYIYITVALFFFSNKSYEAGSVALFFSTKEHLKFSNKLYEAGFVALFFIYTIFYTCFDGVHFNVFQRSELSIFITLFIDHPCTKLDKSSRTVDKFKTIKTFICSEKMDKYGL